MARTRSGRDLCTTIAHPRITFLLKGDLGGHPVDMQLELYDRNKFTLVSRGFHWVQEYPFHR